MHIHPPRGAAAKSLVCSMLLLFCWLLGLFYEYDDVSLPLLLCSCSTHLPPTLQ